MQYSKQKLDIKHKGISSSTIIYMFDEDFSNNLQQPLGDNLWPTHSIN
jgi:hypothetical protein